MSDDCEKRTRQLYQWEIDEYQQIFGSSLKYERIRIHECAPFPDFVDRLGRKLKRMPPPGENEHNAITLGNHCYFPVQLPADWLPYGHPEAYKLDWLLHELTHTWQYQQVGWRYIYLALRAQFRDKDKAYDYGGEDGLLKSRQKQKHFKDFNPEQQGNIVQEYYVRQRAGKDVSAWRPFIDEVQKGWWV